MSVLQAIAICVISVPVSLFVVFYGCLVVFEGIAVGHVYALCLFEVVFGLVGVAARVAFALLQVCLALLLRGVALAFQSTQRVFFYFTVKLQF